MQFLIETTSLETHKFLAPFFNGAIFAYPGVNSEEIAVARNDEGSICGALQYRFNFHNKTAAISFICVVPGSKLSVFGGLIEKFLSRLEELGITTFYASVPQKHYDAYGIADLEKQTSIRKRRYPTMTRWKSYLHEIVPPQEVATSHAVKTLTLANRTFVHPTIVIKYELKDEYRNI